MNKPTKVLTIIGSPNGRRSNTLAFANDFLDDVESAGLELEREVIVLGEKTVKPCKGCWNCTMGKPCPLRDDDLAEIKRAMIDCDLLVLGSPVYTNQVTAQMKALIDRLFTWCHVFPLLGKYAISVTTTGNDGHKEVADYLEKILATYGTASFGSVIGTGSYTPGFYPRRQSEGEKYKKLAQKVASTILAGKKPRPTAWRRKMFSAMKRKLTGVRTIQYIVNGPSDEVPAPPKFLLRMIQTKMKKRNVSIDQTRKLSKLMSFEFSWWTDRDWHTAKSISQLESKPVPKSFDLHERLIG